MKKFMTTAVLMAAMCIFAGCATSKDKPAEATTEDIYAQEEITPVEMTASEFVELGKYKGLSITVEKTEVTEADVEEEIESYLQGYVDYKEVKDRDTVKEGDYLSIDYTCKIDGKKNEEYSDEDAEMKAGGGEMNEYLGNGLGDDFEVESKVIGSKLGSTVTTEFSFPKDYDDESVAGKKCTMEITINSISTEVIPELNDDFIQEYTDCKTVDEYRKEVRKSLEEQAEDEFDASSREELWNQIVENAKLKKDFTKEMIDQEIDNLKIQNKEIAEFYFGMDVEEYLTESTGMTLEKYAEFSLKGQCVQSLLEEAEKITVTDEDIQEEYKTIADENEMDNIEDAKEVYTEDELHSMIISRKLFDKLMTYTDVKTVPASTEDIEEVEVEE